MCGTGDFARKTFRELFGAGLFLPAGLQASITIRTTQWVIEVSQLC